MLFSVFTDQNQNDTSIKKIPFISTFSPSQCLSYLSKTFVKLSAIYFPLNSERMILRSKNYVRRVGGRRNKKPAYIMGMMFNLIHFCIT